MQFITSLFGGSDNTWLTAAFALGIVLILVVIGVWLLKLIFGATGRVARGRNRRLAVVDTLALDPKRQLLIIRRDDVEHLILTGGPQDVVVETGIAVAEAPAAAQPTRRPIPMVAARKGRAPAPAAAPAPAPVTEPAPAQPASEPLTAVEKLRELGKPANERGPRSLRHTALLRPVSEGDMALSPEISGSPASPAADSAKEDAAQQLIEGRDLAEGHSDANRN